MLPPTPSTNAQTVKNVERSFQELNDAIIGHSKWLTEWNTRVVCGIPIEDTHFSEESYKTCYFGKWYYGEQPSFLHEKPEFTALDDLHQKVYKEARVIVNKANKGEPISRTEYNPFIVAEAAFSEAIVKLRDDLYKLLLSYDYLTGVLNRQAFFHILEKEYARVKRFGDPCCIVLLDIDYFKEINDKFGHAAGDAALVYIIQRIGKSMRPYDSICRYGGEEFLICMPKTTVDMAHDIIERMRLALHNENICITDANCLVVSASFGIAPMIAEQDLDTIIEHADEALYQAKHSGRNKVKIWLDSA